MIINSMLCNSIVVAPIYCADYRRRFVYLIRVNNIFSKSRSRNRKSVSESVLVWDME